MVWKCLGLGVFKVEEVQVLVNTVKTAIEYGYRSIDTAAIYGNEATIAAYEESLTKLGVDYLDLYLIHWPVAGKYKETWRA